MGIICQSEVQNLFLSQPNSLSGLATRAVLFEAAGEFTQADKLWSEVLEQPSNLPDDDPLQDSASAVKLPAAEQAAYQLLKNASTWDGIGCSWPF